MESFILGLCTLCVYIKIQGHGLQSQMPSCGPYSHKEAIVCSCPGENCLKKSWRNTVPEGSLRTAALNEQSLFSLRNNHI